MIINCNFGNEEVAADIAQAIGKPVVLWAPLDDEYYKDGMRPTDSQSGLFGVSRQMQRFHIPFSHIPCCRVESAEFKESFESFVRVACMVKNFKGMRIGRVGASLAPFFSVIWNEGELMEKFGLKIIPSNFAVIEQKMKDTAELLWHCGPFPISQKAPTGIDSEARLVNQRSWFRGKDGTYTVARIDQEGGNYKILPLVCKTTEGPQTHGTYIWGEFEDLQAVEDKLLDGPYIHHFLEMEGDYVKEIKEFCKYFKKFKC